MNCMSGKGCWRCLFYKGFAQDRPVAVDHGPGPAASRPLSGLCDGTFRYAMEHSAIKKKKKRGAAPGNPKTETGLVQKVFICDPFAKE